MERKTKNMLASHVQKGLLLCAFVLNLAPCFSQPDAHLIEKESQKILRTSLHRFIEFLSLPNDAYVQEDLEPNLEWLETEFSKRGFALQRIPTKRIELLLADRKQPEAKKTLLIYLQVDGQPVDPSKWEQEDPFTPVLKQKNNTGGWDILPLSLLERTIDPEWRIFARAASDAKGPIAALLSALDISERLGIRPNYNLKIIMDCEEEMGSPNLSAAVEKNKHLLQADMLIILDGPRHISNQPTLTFGARGITTMRITTYGPRVPQHSGHYGNYAPNPALRMAQLLASMKDNQGRVTIPGFYDGVHLTEEVKRILTQVPDDEEMIKSNLGIANIDSVANNYQEAIQYPSLNIRGLSSAWVGTKARTIIPHAAVVNLDIRTVKETDPERLVNLVRNHIQEQGFHICAGEPTEDERQKYAKLLSMSYHVSYGAFRTDFNSEVGQFLNSALTRVFGSPPIKIRTSGGSIPIAPFVRTLGIPAVTVPTVNRDNNQHSPNENIRIGNYLDAIRTFVSILTEEM